MFIFIPYLHYSVFFMLVNFVLVNSLNASMYHSAFFYVLYVLVFCDSKRTLSLFPTANLRTNCTVFVLIKCIYSTVKLAKAAYTFVM